MIEVSFQLLAATRPLSRIAAVGVGVVLALSAPALAAEWRPVTPEELALKQSKSDPNADAECLFREVRIDNEVIGSIHNQTINYIRFKIFNDRGSEKYANRTIEYANKEHVSDVAARTIHPDGSVVEVGKDAIFDKVAVKKGGLKVHEISFGFAAVTPGSIVEYRWAVDGGEGYYRYMPVNIQTEFPVDEVTFRVKSAESLRYGIPAMRALYFGATPEQGRPDAAGFQPFTFRNVPAYHDEPFSPPGRAGKKWMLIYYEENDKAAGEQYWNAVGRRFNSEAKENIKVSGEMKQASAEITGAGKTDDEKLALLVAWCQKNIKNLWGADVTTEEREAYKKENHNSADTFRRKVGTSQDIDYVFIALAQAAGYDARDARVADRREFIFNPEVHSAFFVNNSDAAVQVGGKWKFYDVSDEFAPAGTLTWVEQGVSALMPDSKQSNWVQTPLLTSDETKIQRVADLTLSPDCDVEGDIRELYWGNESINWRLEHFHQNDSERETHIRDTLKERYADFEVSKIKVTALPDAGKPVGISYHLSVKGYCQRTGKRLFVRPSFFTVGGAAYFTEAERHNAIYFPYPWREDDSIQIHLPAGFQLDHPEAPASFKVPPIQWMAKAGYNPATNTLVYRRTFAVGSDSVVWIDAANYKAAKTVFDQVHTNDEHIIALKQADANAPAGPAPTATQQ